MVWVFFLFSVYYGVSSMIHVLKNFRAAIRIVLSPHTVFELSFLFLKKSILIKKIILIRKQNKNKQNVFLCFLKEKKSVCVFACIEYLPFALFILIFAEMKEPFFWGRDN